MNLNVLWRGRVYYMHRETVLPVNKIEKTFKLQRVFYCANLQAPLLLKPQKRFQV